MPGAGGNVPDVGTLMTDRDTRFWAQRKVGSMLSMVFRRCKSSTTWLLKVGVVIPEIVTAALDYITLPLLVVMAMVRDRWVAMLRRSGCRAPHSCLIVCCSMTR
jgi:hypothetical protein